MCAVYLSLRMASTEQSTPVPSSAEGGASGSGGILSSGGGGSGRKRKAAPAALHLPPPPPLLTKAEAAAVKSRYHGLRYRGDGSGYRLPWDVRLRMPPRAGARPANVELTRVSSPEEASGCCSLDPCVSSMSAVERRRQANAAARKQLSEQSFRTCLCIVSGPPPPQLAAGRRGF